MATVPDNNATSNTMNGEDSTHGRDFEHATRNMTHEEKTTAQHAARFGYGPLAHARTNNTDSALPGELILTSMWPYMY